MWPKRDDQKVMTKKIMILCLLLSGCILRQKQPISDPTLIAIGSWHGLEALSFCVDENFGPYRDEIREVAAKTAQDWTEYGRLTVQPLPDCDGQQNITIVKTTDEASSRGSAQIPSRFSSHVTMLSLIHI